MKKVKIFIYILFAIMFFIIGYYSNKYTNQKSSYSIFHLEDSIILYQDGNEVGKLNAGAMLSYEGSMDEGFHKVNLLINYYEKPDSLKYYRLEKSVFVNPKIPCWSDKDVQPIKKK